MAIGLIQVYTGEGKGKTTAALGLAMRAAGHGQKTVMVQFLKPGTDSGERKSAAQYLPYLQIFSYGGARFVDKDNIAQQDRELAQAAWQKCRRVAKAELVDILILDEISLAIAYGLLDLAAVLRFLEQKPPRLELVLTGRHMPPEIIAAADLVTEMKKIKHPFDQGIAARKGIEY